MQKSAMLLSARHEIKRPGEDIAFVFLKTHLLISWPPVEAFWQWLS